ncbi:hypothetical protein NLG97_g8132 [Lecanicillium saksenae]|uniref:Uncharacterized protein n=1 Tax=Lecanicillium saksenae TaxID=468837 RepID=A0ACC1QLQ5_9HYPO|nr:hypothetical protein NLG97_g8132 [Lecanicillium saksenae]
MKLSTIALAFCVAISATVAAPNAVVRQNDVVDCVDGIGGDSRTYATQAECREHCQLKENADGERKGRNCRGFCGPTGGSPNHVALQSCRGELLHVLDVLEIEPTR